MTVHSHGLRAAFVRDTLSPNALLKPEASTVRRLDEGQSRRLQEWIANLNLPDVDRNAAGLEPV